MYMPWGQEDIRSPWDLCQLKIMDTAHIFPFSHLGKNWFGRSPISRRFPIWTLNTPHLPLRDGPCVKGFTGPCGLKESPKQLPDGRFWYLTSKIVFGIVVMCREKSGTQSASDSLETSLWHFFALRAETFLCSVQKLHQWYLTASQKVNQVGDLLSLWACSETPIQLKKS